MELFVDGIIPGHMAVIVKSHGAVKKIKEKESKKAYGQAAVVQSVAFVPGVGPGQESGDEKAQHKAEHKGQEDAGNSQPDLPQHKSALSVAEQKLADKGAEAGGEHAYMEIFFIVQFFYSQIQEHGQKGRPHIEKIQPVEAVGRYQEVSGQSVGPGLSF